jgi:hypothetical protein
LRSGEIAAGSDTWIAPGQAYPKYTMRHHLPLFRQVADQVTHLNCFWAERFGDQLGAGENGRHHTVSFCRRHHASGFAEAFVAMISANTLAT